jgi:hypothetical protein
MSDLSASTKNLTSAPKALFLGPYFHFDEIATFSTSRRG